MLFEHLRFPGLLSALFSLSIQANPDVFLLDLQVLRLVLEENVQALGIQVVELLERGRQKFVPLCIKNFLLELALEPVQCRLGLILSVCALLAEAINVLSHSLLPFNHGYGVLFLTRTSKVLLVQLRLHAPLFLIKFGCGDAR